MPVLPNSSNATPWGEWDLQETSGTIAVNTSGSFGTAIDGVYVGGPTLGVAGPPTGGPAVRFHSAGHQYVRVPYLSAAMGAEDVLVVHAWVKFNTMTSRCRIVARSSGGTRSWGVGFDPDGFGGINGLITNYTVADTNMVLGLTTGTWYECVWLYNRGGNGFMWVNGVGPVAGTNPLGGPPLHASTNDLIIGGSLEFGGEEFFDGDMADVWVASRYIEVINFIAGGTDGSGMFAVASPDGAEWTPRLSPAVAHGGTTTGACAAFGAGRWVVGAFQSNVGDTDTVILTSDDDGYTWSEQVTPFDGGQVLDVLYAGGLWIAVGDSADSTKTIMTSTDAETWIARSNPLDPGGIANSVAHGDGLWVVVADDNKIVRSTNGMDWDSSTVALNVVFGVAFGAGLWVAGGVHPTHAFTIITSPDAVIWTAATSPWDGIPQGQVTSVTFDGRKFVAGGDTYFALPSKTIATSADGRSWVQQTSAFDGGNGSYVADVVSSGPGGLFVAVGNDSPQTAEIMSSPDGDVWTLRSSPLGFIRGVGTRPFLPIPPAQAVASAVGRRVHRLGRPA